MGVSDSLGYNRVGQLLAHCMQQWQSCAAPWNQYILLLLCGALQCRVRLCCPLQKQMELEQAESCLREQMQALQRKLVRTVTENEALRHVVDKLQFSVLALRRQLQRVGLTPDVVVDDALLRPAPHQVGSSLAGSSPEQRHVFGPCSTLAV